VRGASESEHGRDACNLETPADGDGKRESPVSVHGVGSFGSGKGELYSVDSEEAELHDDLDKENQENCGECLKSSVDVAETRGDGRAHEYCVSISEKKELFEEDELTKCVRSITNISFCSRGRQGRSTYMIINRARYLMRRKRVLRRPHRCCQMNLTCASPTVSVQSLASDRDSAHFAVKCND
jgi:hypothetical protein